MKLAIFGANGRTGRPLVEQALAAGHDVVAFVRDPAKLDITNPHLTVVAGAVSDAAAVEKAVAGADAVLSTLGQNKTSGKNVVAEATRNILAAMRKHGVRRFISETGAGVHDNHDPKSVGATVMVTLLKTLQPAVLNDAEAHAALLRGSDVEWVLVRAPRLLDGLHTGKYRSGYLALGPSGKITRADVADFMLKQVTDDTYVRQAPMVSY